MSEERQKWMTSHPVRDVLFCIFAGATACGLLARNWKWVLLPQHFGWVPSSLYLPNRWDADRAVLIGGIFGVVVGLALWTVAASKRNRLGNGAGPPTARNPAWRSGRPWWWSWRWWRIR
jgi:hypothetical protein